MNAPAIYGLLACALVAGCAAALAARSVPDYRRLPVAAGVALVLLIPAFAGESGAMWLHGAVGAPSLTLVQVSLLRVLPGRWPRLPGPTAAWLIAGFAAVFYPLALGLGPWDPYGPGYRPLLLLMALLLLAGLLARGRHAAWLLILGVDLLGYAAGLYANLWDALIDPLLALAAAATALASVARAGRGPASRE